MTSAFWSLFALISFLAVAQAAPPHAGKQHQPQAQWQKRQPDLEAFTLTETRVEVFSETMTETFTETFTTSEPTGSATQINSGLTVTSAFTLPSQEVHVEGDVPNQDPEAQDVLFLPVVSPDPATPTGTDSDSDSDSGSDSDATASSTDSASASSAPSPTDSDATATEYAGDDGPDFAKHTPVVKGPLLSAYYPVWAASVLSPEKIDMSRMDWIDFAFGNLNEDFSIGLDDPDVLKRVVAAAHAKGTKVKLSIGGWTGSKYFSTACASSASRTTFVNNMASIYSQYKLDGLDIDWEYPGQQGAGQNVVSPQDSANFLVTLKLLRSKLPRGARITAAVQDAPFAGPDGKPLTDVSDFAAVLDWVNIMNYDVFSSSSNPGPNAPLDNGCQDSSQPQFNAKSSVKAWTDAKFPASRLMLGVPFYGYVNPSSATQLQHKKRSLTAPDGLVRRQVQESFVIQNGTTVAGTSAAPRPPFASGLPIPLPSIVVNITDAASNATSADPASKAAQDAVAGTVTLTSSDGTTNSGQLQFSSLISQGALLPVRVVNGATVSDSTTFIAIGGFTRFWDTCSSTPFLTSSYADPKQVITYDDPQSLGLKASFAKQSQLLGTAVWDLSGDTAQWDLMNALRRGLGKSV